MDYEIERSTRHCATTGREFSEGEEFYSVVDEVDGSLRRRDYSLEAWNGPPADALASWKCRMPRREASKKRVAPSELLLELFHQLASQPGQAPLRYVLTLLMIRRRIFRLEETTCGESGAECLSVYCPRDEASYQVPAADVDAEQIQAIQDELSRVLAAPPASSPSGQPAESEKQTGSSG